MKGMTCLFRPFATTLERLLLMDLGLILGEFSCVVAFYRSSVVNLGCWAEAWLIFMYYF